MAFKHRGFWQCLDTKGDLDLLIEMSKRKNSLGMIKKVLVIGGSGFIGSNIVKVFKA